MVDFGEDFEKENQASIDPNKYRISFCSVTVSINHLFN